MASAPLTDNDYHRERSALRVSYLAILLVTVQIVTWGWNIVNHPNNPANVVLIVLCVICVLLVFWLLPDALELYRRCQRYAYQKAADAKLNPWDLSGLVSLSMSTCFEWEVLYKLTVQPNNLKRVLGFIIVIAINSS